MEVRDASLYEDILKIASVPPENPEFTWVVTLFTPDGEIILDGIKSKTISRDYVKNFSDQTMLNFEVGIGTYTNRIYPHKDNLKVEIFKRPIVRSTSSTIDSSIPASKELYRAILVDQSSLGLRASSEMTADEEAGDRSKRIGVSLQLVESLLDTLRTRTLSGIFAGSWSDVLKACCSAKLKTEPWSYEVDLDLVRQHQQHELAGVDVREPDNKVNPKQLLIRAGTKLKTLPDYIQERYGLYNHSLGSYIERGEWYIWGLHNTRLFQDSDRTLTIALVDSSAMPTTDNSFSVEEKHVKMVAGGEVKHIDPSESRLQNLGNGIRYQDANKLMDTYADTTKGKTTISRAANVREFKVEERADGLNYVPYAKDKLTSNHYQQLSELNERRGAIVNVQWQNSDPDVLRPGMPTKILYANKDNVKSIEGILIGCQHAFSKETEQYTETRVRCNSALTLWIDRDV